MIANFELVLTTVHIQPNFMLLFGLVFSAFRANYCILLHKCIQNEITTSWCSLGFFCRYPGAVLLFMSVHDGVVWFL